MGVRERESDFDNLKSVCGSSVLLLNQEAQSPGHHKVRRNGNRPMFRKWTKPVATWPPSPSALGWVRWLVSVRVYILMYSPPDI